jgi:limonene-1,2-epoxide hydrolase
VVSEIDVRTIATTCLEAWTSGHLATARSLLRDDVILVGPLGAKRGVDECMAELEGLAKIATGAEQKRVIVDGDEVCIFYDLMTILAGPLPTSGWYHVRHGKIDWIRDYFDARLLTQVPGRDDRDQVPDHGSDVGKPSPGLCLPVFFSAELEIADWDDSA